MGGGAARKYFSIVVALAMIVGGVAAIIRPYNNKTAADTSYYGVSISSISPNSGPIGGGTKITINGQGFLQNAEFTDISVGQNYACGISNGDVYCWGDNTYGQLGDGTKTTRPKPTKIDMSQIADADNVKFKQVAAGYYHTCAVTTGGYAICWGKNDVGQRGCNLSYGGNGAIVCTDRQTEIERSVYYNLSSNYQYGESLSMNYITDSWDGDYSSDRMGTQRISAMSGISQITVGEDYTCYLGVSGGATCFGKNDFGQLGWGSTSDSSWLSNATAFNYVGGYTGVTYITAGERKTCFVRDNSGTRELYCWGWSGGPIAQGSAVTEPNLIETSYTNRSNGQVTYYFSDVDPVVKSDAVYWIDFFGSVSGSSSDIRMTGVDVGGSVEGSLGGQITMLAAGDQHMCALYNYYSTTCWGDNSYFQTGSVGKNHIDINSASEHPTISQEFSKIDAGGNSTCGIEEGTGVVYCWGQNNRGQLGRNYASSGKATPQQVSLFSSPTVNGANIGGKDCANFTIVSNTQVTCTTPAGDAAGAVDVELYTPGNGRLTASKTDGFTYVAERPIVTGVSKEWVDWENIYNENYGDGEDNAASITIEGENFDHVSEVSPTLCTGSAILEWGTIQGLKFKVGSSNAIMCNMIHYTPSGTLAGRHKVTVTNPAGTSQENVYVVVSRDSSLIDESFTLSRSSAMVGELAGQLTIEAEGFGPDLTNPSVGVKIGGKTCSNAHFEDDAYGTKITCTLPEFTTADIGTKDVVITGIYNQLGDTITLAKKFQVVAPTLTIEEPLGEVNLNLQPGKFSSAPLAVKVATNNPAGYNLSMRFANSNLTMAGNAKKIPSLSGYTSSQATSSVVNRKIGQEAFWAYRLGTSENTAETNTATTNYSWSTIPTTDKIIKQGSQTFAIGATSKFEQTDVYFGASATMENPAGTYRATATFTVASI